jgi:WD40 repeat protein
MEKLRISRRVGIVVVVLASVLAIPSLVYATPFVFGDVFASVGSGKVKVFTPTGVVVDLLNTTTGATETAGSAFDATGNFFVTGFQTSTLSKFNNSGGLLSANFIAGNNPPNNESLVFDKVGNFYVGGAGGNTIRKFNSAGTLMNTFTVATQDRGTDWIDLAADQHTIFYTSAGSEIKRFDTLTNTQLADFSNVGGTEYALRILSDGGVLVAHNANVLHFNSSGAIVQTCDIPGGSGLLSLSLDPDGKSFWTGSVDRVGTIFHVDLSNCAVLGQFDSAPFVDLAGLSVFGEVMQGGNAVPEPTTFCLLGAGLVGLTRMKKRW